MILGSASKIGIGTTAPATALHINSAAAAPLTLETTDLGGDITLKSTASTPADGSTIMALRWEAKDDGGNNTVYGILQCAVESDAGGSEKGGLNVVLANAAGSTAEVMTIMGDGKVGIGTAAPTFAVLNEGALELEAVGDQFPGVRIERSGGSSYTNRAYELLLNNTGDLNFYDATATASRMIILDSGQVGIGCTNPHNILQIQVGTGHRIGFWGASTYCAIQAGNDANNAQTPLRFDASNYQFMTGQVGIGSTSPGQSLDVVGSGRFTHDAINGPMVRIDNSNGDTIILQNFQRTNSGGTIYGNARGGLQYIAFGATTASLIMNTADVKIEMGTNGTVRTKIASGGGDFYTNDGTVSSLSDSRVKKNVTDLADGLSIINQLRPITYQYNGKAQMANDDSVTRYGFIADEVQSVASHYVEESIEKIDGVEVDDFKSLSTTRMIPMMMKALQELSAKVTALENA